MATMKFEAGAVSTATAPAKLQQMVQTYSTDASTILEKLFVMATRDGTTSQEPEYVPLRKRNFPTSFWNFMAETGGTGPTGLTHPRPRAAYTVKKGKLFAEQAPAAAVAAAAAAASPAAASPKKTMIEAETAATGAERKASISKPSLLERTPNRPEKPSRKLSVSGKSEKEKKRPKTPAKATADSGASKTDKRRKSAGAGASNRKSKISQMGKRLLASTTSNKGGRESPISSLRASRFIDIRGLSPASSEDSQISPLTDRSLAELGCVSPFCTPTPDIMHHHNQQRSLSCPPITGNYGMDTPMQMVGLVDDFALEQEFSVVQRGHGARSMLELGGQDAIHLLGNMDTSMDLFDDGPDSPGPMSPELLFSDHRLQKPSVLFAPEARPLGTFTTIKMETIR